jgi:hypothetical protein
MWSSLGCLDMAPKRRLQLLTEDQVQRSFRRLFSNPDFTEADIEKAESLIDQLRPESPLRHRLLVELDELRTLCLAKS